MKSPGLLLRFLALSCLVLPATQAAAPKGEPARTQNVILVMIDGVRWQEVFRGADPDLLAAGCASKDEEMQEKSQVATKRFQGASPAERRQRLMPFLWSQVAAQGQLFGNRDLGSVSHVTNGLNFSYPGYAETLTGIADPRVASNDNVPNPNATVFEWLNGRPGFKGRVAAFGAWDVFDGIFRKATCGFLVNACDTPLEGAAGNPARTLLNELKAETPLPWAHEVVDSLMFHSALDYLRHESPRLLFVGLGETDEWAHSGAYADYLTALHRADGYLERLWKDVQSNKAYRGRTTLIVLPDHGRGTGKYWTNHSKDTVDSDQTWMAYLGPDTAALGEHHAGEAVGENQVAATVAAFLGEDYCQAVPAAGAPIPDVLPAKKP